MRVGRRRLLGGAIASLALMTGAGRAGAQTAGAPGEAALLLASATLKSSLFAQSVVLVTRTPTGESIGLVLNRRAQGSLQPDPPLPGQGGAAADIFRGGPLATSTDFALVETDTAVADTLDVAPGIRLGAGISRVRRLLQGAGAGRRRIFSGYAGWAPGQLADELGGGFWSARHVEADIVFDPDPDSLWVRLTAPGRAVRVEEPLPPAHRSALLL